MADEAQRFTTRTGSLQSRIAKSKNAKQQQAASSSAAAKSGSTTTPTITSTPKVTNTAKAMPSVTRVDISKLAVPTVTPTVTTPREQAMNLLGSKTRVEPLKKAEVPNMLDGQVQPTGIAGTINKRLYEIPQKITQEFGETVKESNLFEKGKNLVIDTARFGISTAQGLLEKYGASNVLPNIHYGLGVYDEPFVKSANQWINNTDEGIRIKEKRDNTLKTIFDELESRDQWLSKREGYQESKKEADEWAESGRGIRQALQEENWDVVITRAGEIIAQMIPAFATAVITKNPKIAAGTVFTTVYGDAYKRNLTDVVKDPDYKDLTGQQKTDLASLLATTEATIETLGDMLELAPFMKGKTSISKMLGIKNALASFVANWQGSAITEGLEEVSTEVLQTWLKQAYGSLDEISLKELGQIFSDTYLLMQIAGLGGGAGGVVETRNRNKVEKILEQEAKKFNNFNDFEAAAQRGGIEDNSIIQDAWAKAKGLTKEQSQTIKYDVKYVEKQEEETTKLYEEKESVENKLESLRESGEEKNKTQISKLETRLQEIDNQINEIDKSIQEYMNTYGEELPAEQQEKETQAALEELYNEINGIGGEVEIENDVKESRMDEDKERTPEFKNWFGDWETDPDNSSKAVNEDGTPLHLYHGTRYNIKVPDMTKGKFQAYGNGMYFTTNKESAESYSKEIKNISGIFRRPRVMEVYLNIRNPLKEGLYNWNDKRTEELKRLGYTVNEGFLANKNIDDLNKYEALWILQDKEKRKTFTEDFSKITGYDGLVANQEGEQYWVAFSPNQVKSVDNVGTFSTINNNIYRNVSNNNQPSQIEEPVVFSSAQDYVDKMLDYTEKKRGYRLSKTERADLEEKYMHDFLIKNLEGDFSRHMFGLKGVNLKDMDGKLTDEKLSEIVEMLANVSNTFGVDFNKVITDKNLSINIAKHLGTYLNRPFTVGLMSPKYIKERVREFFRGINMKVSETTLDNLGAEIATAGVSVSLRDGPQRAGEIMSHELFHLIDFAISTEEGLPLVLKRKGRSKNRTLYYTSIIDGDKSWKTFKKGSADPRSDAYRYYNDPSEILARYAEQYFAYKNSPESFENRFAGTEEMKNNKPSEYNNWYWSEEEFLKLLPKFESIIKDRLGAKLLDEENQFYYDVVRRINQGMYNYKELQYNTEGMTETDVQLKLLQIETEYAWILQTVEGMKGNLKEEMEAYVQLSNLQSNYEMAKAKGEEYLNMQRTTPEQQDTMDDITETVVPNPPQQPGEIDNGIPELGGSNIEKGIDEISKGESPDESFMKSYMTETQKIKINNRKNKIKTFRKELGQTMKDLFTPTLSRIYNISPRVAGRLITMETQTEINIHKYRQRAKGFVETLGKLKGKQALEVKMALLDYGALASEQGENIEEYKKEEVAKLKEVLKRNGFKEKDINDMFYVLNDIGQQYKDAGLSINLSDMYFPRVVKDYEGLIDYMNRESGGGIKVNKTSLLIKIRQIQSDPDMTNEEKERRIRNAISIEFKQPGTTSKHGKERKLGLLSERGPGIYAYYENPIQSLDHYIVTMTNAIQRQLFLGGMVEDANITESEILNRNTSESVSTIIGRLVELGMVNEEDVNELQKSILAVINKKPSPKSVTAIKDITYIATITNFLSAINQLDDLGMVILRDRSGLKHIVKTVFGRVGIKYDDLGLEDSYEMFREGGNITNWLFKKSFFNTFDRLGKTSFVNTAWESMVRQSKNEKTRKYLYSRLVAMYGRESADRMMDKIDRNDYRGEDGQVDIEILRDLLYQLGSTQPIYTSAMSTTYLNNPRARLCYALSSFTLKRIDWLIQGTKEVNAKHGPVAAGAWVMGVSSFLAMFGAVIGDLGDLLKGDKEETFLWKFINEGIDEALKSGGSDALDSWLKIWDLSEYDIKTYKQQGLWGVFSSKIKPFIFDLGKDITQAITEGDEDEITDLAKYVPIFGKLVYYWLWDDLESSTDELLDLGEDLDLDLGGDLDLDLDGELLDL